MRADIAADAFGLTNGLLPVAGLMALAIVMPWPFARWIGNDQGRLAVIMLAALIDVTLAGAVLLAALILAQDPSATLGPLAILARSAKMGLAWGPLWALVWLMRSQGIERRRGWLMQHGGTDDRNS